MGGGWGPRDDAQAQEALHGALDLGVDFFDTAYVYGDGHSEKVLGEVLRQTPATSPLAGRRKPYRVATKVPAKILEWPATPKTRIDRAFPTDWIIQCTETSLKRLGLERVDLQQMHVWTDAWAEAEEWKKAAERLKKDGKILAFGVSVNDHEPDSVLQAVASGSLDSVQVIYNLFDQEPAKRLFPLAQEHGVAIIVRVPFDEGALTGTFSPDTKFPRGDWRAGYFKEERLAETCRRVERLKPFLGPETPTLPALALKFILSHPAVSTVIPGMRRRAHVEQNCAAAEGPALSSSTLEKLKEHAWPRNFYAGVWD